MPVVRPADEDRIQTGVGKELAIVFVGCAAFKRAGSRLFCVRVLHLFLSIGETPRVHITKGGYLHVRHGKELRQIDMHGLPSNADYAYRNAIARIRFPQQ